MKTAGRDECVVVVVVDVLVATVLVLEVVLVVVAVEIMKFRLDSSRNVGRPWGGAGLAGGGRGDGAGGGRGLGGGGGGVEEVELIVQRIRVPGSNIQFNLVGLLNDAETDIPELGTYAPSADVFGEFDVVFRWVGKDCSDSQIGICAFHFLNSFNVEGSESDFLLHLMGADGFDCSHLRAFSFEFAQKVNLSTSGSENFLERGNLLAGSGIERADGLKG